MRRFKKEVSIGDFHGYDLDGLVKGLITQAECEDSIEELRAVLVQTLATLAVSFPSTKSVSELCEGE